MLLRYHHGKLLSNREIILRPTVDFLTIKTTFFPFNG